MSLRPRSLGRLLFAALALGSVFGVTQLHAQQLRIASSGAFGATIPPGGPYGLLVRLDSATETIGWSFGLAFDPTLTTVDAVTPTALVQTSFAGGPPEFQAITMYPDGFTVEAVVCSTGCSGIAPGSFLELYDVSGEALALGIADFCFVDTLGSPPVPIVIVDPSGPSVPSTPHCGEICISENQPWEFTLSETAVAYPSATGLAEVTVTASIGQYPCYGDYANSPGFSMGIAHDPNTLDPVEIRPAPILADLNDGDGPDFMGTIVASDGIGVGVVTSFVGDAWMNFVGETPVIFVDYVTVPGSLIGAIDPVTTVVEYSDSIGQPPYATVVNPGDSGWVPEQYPGSVTLTPVSGEPYIRGDTNDDGGLDLADAIYLLEHLFSGGPAPYCAEVGDINTDGATNIGDPICITGYLFAGGHPPHPPFPNCGVIQPDECAVGSSFCP